MSELFERIALIFIASLAVAALAHFTIKNQDIVYAVIILSNILLAIYVQILYKD